MACVGLQRAYAPCWATLTLPQVHADARLAGGGQAGACVRTALSAQIHSPRIAPLA